jgi:hypothetical protein
MRTLSFLATATLLATVLPAQLPPCAFTPIRPTCGPILAGADRIVTHNKKQYHVITFKAGHAPASAIGVLAFGTKQIKVRFPGTKCFLLTNVSPSWAIPFHTGRHGTVSVTFRVAGKLAGTIYAQSAFVKAKHLTTSNALKIVCR